MLVSRTLADVLLADPDAFRPSEVLQRVAAVRYPADDTPTRPLTAQELKLLAQYLMLPAARITAELLRIQAASRSRHKLGEPAAGMTAAEMDKACSSKRLREWAVERGLFTRGELKELRKPAVVAAVVEFLRL